MIQPAQTLSELIRHLDHNFSSPAPTVIQMYESLSMCQATFFEKFKAVTGCSPAKYIDFKRLAKAASLLATTLTIREIILQCGWRDGDGYFREKFRKRYGCTPTEYRKSLHTAAIKTPTAKRR